MSKPDDLTTAIQAVIECANQAPYDLCGDQREFYLPRLNRAMVTLMTKFPAQSFEAMELARDAWGELLVKPEG